MCLSPKWLTIKESLRFDALESSFMTMQLKTFQFRSFYDRSVPHFGKNIPLTMEAEYLYKYENNAQNWKHTPKVFEDLKLPNKHERRNHKRSKPQLEDDFGCKKWSCANCGHSWSCIHRREFF